MKRFWDKVDKSGGPEACWPWTAGRSGGGYGYLWSSTKKTMVRAHRVSWELHHDRSIPDGLHVLHGCDNPPCVNPAHLELGTAADNARDREIRQRSSAGFLRKLTEDDVRAIRRLGHLNTAELSVLFGVTDTMISYIRHRRWWKHVV